MSRFAVGGCCIGKMRAGQRVWRLPPQLEGCTHALLWGWHAAADGWAALPLLVEGKPGFSLTNFTADAACCGLGNASCYAVGGRCNGKICADGPRGHRMRCCGGGMLLLMGGRHHHSWWSVRRFLVPKGGGRNSTGWPYTLTK
jgi:hypothetical protein